MTNDTEPYIPIECALHSQYELAIVHNSRCRLVWIDSANNTHSKTVAPLDLLIHNKKEYLKIRTEAEDIVEIRLDRIVSHSVI